MQVNLTKDSVNKYFVDKLGNLYLVLQEEVPCSRMKYYLLSEVNTLNTYNYDCMGRRFDHMFNIDTNSPLNLAFH